MVTISKVTMIIASKCGRFWALHILVQCAFRYFSCGKRNEIFRLRKVVLKLTALVPSPLQRCRSNRDFGRSSEQKSRRCYLAWNLSRALKSLRAAVAVLRGKKDRDCRVFEASSFFFGPWLLASPPLFLRDAVAHGPKARFNANQQQKIARAHPSGAFKDGKVWFAKNVKNSNWKRQSRGQGTADERDWGRCAKYPTENTRKDF